MTRVLIVDDSAVVRSLLISIFASAPDIEVIDTARNGLEAIQAIARNKPDVVTMDINMPVMDGFEATRQIMESQPVPIVIVSSLFSPAEIQISFKAMEAGALTILARPYAPGHPEYEKTAATLIDTVKSMAGVHMMRRSRTRPHVLPKQSDGYASKKIELLMIGASTGGPIALCTLLQALKPNFPVPIAVVQHIASGFCGSFVDWLSQSTKIPTEIAQNAARLLPGHIYVAPDNAHFEIGIGLVAQINSAPPDSGLRPSVKRLFGSAGAILGKQVAAVLLTGMGKDGAEELLALKHLGAITMAQDQESCVVFGMPGEAVRLGAANFVLPPDLMAAQLNQIIGNER